MRPDDGRVVSNFIVSALVGRPLTIYGDGSQTRSFCYVDDLVDGLVRLMNTPHEVTGPINLGNPNEFSMSELATKIIALAGRGVSIEYHPSPSDEPTQRQPTITKAKEILDWSPQVELDEGLATAIEYFRRQLR
jgi:UDP-glucuronate decarboxylase